MRKNSPRSERCQTIHFFEFLIGLHLPVESRRLPFLHFALQMPLELRRFGSEHGFEHASFAFTNFIGALHFLTHLLSDL